MNVSIKRRGKKELIEYTITRDKIPIYSVDASYMLDNETGYIKLNKFAATTEKEFTDALSGLGVPVVQERRVLAATERPEEGVADRHDHVYRLQLMPGSLQEGEWTCGRGRETALGNRLYGTGGTRRHLRPQDVPALSRAHLRIGLPGRRIHKNTRRTGRVR